MATAVRLAFTPIVNRILFATDLSPSSRAALPYAATLAAQFGAKLDMIHVLPFRPPPTEAGADAADRDPVLDWARQELDRLWPPGEATQGTGIQRGPLWPVLEKAIQDRQVDLLIIGKQGWHERPDQVLGSGAKEIFFRASCPVMTVAAHAHPTHKEQAGQFRSVLYPTDFSGESMRALPYALELAWENCAKFTLLHVLPGAGVARAIPSELAGNCSRRLLKLAPVSLRRICPTDAVVAFGSVGQCILRLAGEQHMGIIVMGLKKRSPREATALPSWAIAHQIVNEARCPVLTVRA